MEDIRREEEMTALDASLSKAVEKLIKQQMTYEVSKQVSQLIEKEVKAQIAALDIQDRVYKELDKALKHLGLAVQNVAMSNAAHTYTRELDQEIARLKREIAEIGRVPRDKA